MRNSGNAAAIAIGVKSMALMALMALNASAGRAQTIDQQQPLIDPLGGPQAIDSHSDSQQKLAQTFRVGTAGRLMAIDLPCRCTGGAELILEVRRQAAGRPDGEFLRSARRTFPEASVPTFQRTYLPVPIDVVPGDLLVFTLRIAGSGSCSIAASAGEAVYADGQAFFDARPNPPGWAPMEGSPGVASDLAFRTVMEDAGGGPATSSRGCILVRGPGPLPPPVRADLPICRCFRDEGLRSMRCGILTPDFFVWRDLATPLEAGKPYEEVWELLPAQTFRGVVKMTIRGTDFAKPLVHTFGSKLKGGQAERFVVRGLAPSDLAKFQGSATFEYQPTGTGTPRERLEVDRVVDLDRN